MLSDKSAQVIRDTLPAVGAAIGEITPLFYDKMFTAHPELIRDLFNRGNQAQGDQPLALAGSIAAYATMQVSDSTHPIEQLLARIAHKHVSLGVTTEQYAIVHEHLFAAIVQVLGEAVTPEVAAAWDELYWHMADDLIRMEQGLYDDAGVEPGEVWRDVVVAGRQQESPDTVAFSLRAVGSALPAAKPGQYISVTVPLPDGANQIRQYPAGPPSRAGRAGRRPAGSRAAPLVRGPRGAAGNRRHDAGSDRAGEGRRTGRCPGIPVRPAAVHAPGPLGALGARTSRGEHPLRGLRTGQVAGRPLTDDRC